MKDSSIYLGEEYHQNVKLNITAVGKSDDQKLEEINAILGKLHVRTLGINDLDEATEILQKQLSTAKDAIDHYSRQLRIIENYLKPPDPGAEPQKEGRIFCQHFNTSVPKTACDSCGDFLGDDINRCDHQR